MTTRRMLMMGLAAAAMAGVARAKDKGGTSASGTASTNYATSGVQGEMTMAALAAMPKTAPPFEVHLKSANTKYMKGKTKVAISAYGLALVRAGKVSAYGGGFGSESNARRATLTSALVGVSDELATKLVTEAYADLARRLTDAGYEVIPNDVVQASAINRITALPNPAKGLNGWPVFAPEGVPLRAGTLFTSALSGIGTQGPLSKTAEDLGCVILTPGLGIDYEWLESSGSHIYGAGATVGARLRFHALQGSGAYLMMTPPPPYRGGWPASMLMEQGSGTDEPFAIMYEAKDRSDSRALSTAFALAGLGSMYRQSKVYAVEADPDRYAALTRAAFIGFNTALVAEMVKARGG